MSINIAWEFIKEIEGIKREDDNAKILTYNWWFHNMTVPFEWEHNIFWNNLDYADLSFAPELKKIYWWKYKSIDLVDSWSQTKMDSHYARLKDKAVDWLLNLVTHSDNQVVMVFPRKWTNTSKEVIDILGKND